MNDKAQYDVVIVGGGIAGMIAANRAAQLNLRAIVLEQGTDEKYLCNTRYTGGTFHICLREITLDEATLRQKILESTAGFVKPELADVIARDGRRVIRWLQDEGMRFMRASASEYHKWVLAPPGRSRPGLDWEGRCGDVALLRARGIHRRRRLPGRCGPRRTLHFQAAGASQATRRRHGTRRRTENGECGRRGAHRHGSFLWPYAVEGRADER
ncbi:MAG: FAD-binding protein [Betaproteobacteria bacterium]|nr:FAD-binding protein [Betaproteobacteria bacterium]